MPAIAQRTDPYVGAHFFIEVEGVDHGGFSECSGLDAQTEVLEYPEGGNNGYVHKLPGRTKFANVILKYGVTDSTALWEWFQDVIRGKVERKDVSVVLYSNTQEEARRWNLRQAFPVKWTGPAFNGGTPAVAVETLELAHHGFEVE
jgi:phage tail-like protein